MTWILCQIRKTPYLFAWKIGAQQSSQFCSVPKNYSQFMTQSWAQFTELAHIFNNNICWPISLSRGLFWQRRRDFQSGNSSFAEVSCSSTRRTWEKWRRERRGGGQSRKAESWLSRVRDGGSYPWDAARVLGVRWNTCQVILSQAFMWKAAIQEGCQSCVRIECLLWFLTALHLCDKNGGCVQKALIKPKITPHFSVKSEL